LLQADAVAVPNARSKRPCRRRIAEQRDELAALYLRLIFEEPTTIGASRRGRTGDFRDRYQVHRTVNERLVAARGNVSFAESQPRNQQIVRTSTGCLRALAVSLPFD
jgi:hypothetical protein